ncbi:GNAT superfamily N-acetyltransferase [Mycobacterium frederiksbergense]|uniref:GNAT superfamily N-acetyltransferase n=1 Tax=Mycolicibacterium frederiksbergense TaxID=117567 RepID=A0ABT6L493_9MYCO|nr:GNAT family N-acetyltransferase [Mycolicibacterium frederiksbergense]MDH6197140.1 GNAT superfamily N-acetyltransferase [Mycolicibacterium frederiksbergense]
MKAHLFQSPIDFEPVARSVYCAEPVLFTSELTTLCASPWPVGRILLFVSNGHGVAGAAVQTHDSVLLVSGLPTETAMAAVGALTAAEVNLSGVRGTPSTVTAFAHAWHEVTGVWMNESSRDVLYRLGELTPPGGVAGEWRSAGAADAEDVVRWLDGFFIEAFGEPSNLEASRAMLAATVGSGDHILLWTVDGKPVSMARVRAAAVGVSRIGPVYTPPEHRGHGYAAAVTAVAAQFALREGAGEVVLFADADNPVSNRVYQRIGFKAVAENVRCTLAGN